MKKVALFSLVSIALVLISCQGKYFTGYISVSSNPPGADVYLNDSLTGQKTHCLLSDILAGNHTVTLEYPGYFQHMDSVTVNDAETTIVDAKLTKEQDLYISSTPPGAQVYINDSATGKVSDCVLENLHPGNYEIKLVLAEYWVWTDTVNVEETDSIHAWLVEEPVLLWTYQTGNMIRSSPALGLDGTVYITSSDGLFALTAEGFLKWTYEGYDFSPAVGDDGTVYGGGRAWDEDGNFKWVTNIRDWKGSPAVTPDDIIYLGENSSDVFHRVNSEGHIVWSVEMGRVESSPAIDVDGTVYVGSTDHYLYALNPDSSIEWKYKTDGAVSSPAIGSDGTIYVGSTDGFLYALNPDGSLRWRYANVSMSPVIGADGTIYAGSTDQYLYAINPDGTQKWKYQVEVEDGGGVSATPAIGSDGNIYFGASSNRQGGSRIHFMYALRSNGTLLWRYWSEDRIVSFPVISSTGILYIGCEDGKVYAFQTSSVGLASSSWPKFQADNQNTGRAR